MSSPPHARGSTPIDIAVSDPNLVSPARAGIDPVHGYGPTKWRVVTLRAAPDAAPRGARTGHRRRQPPRT